MSGPYDCRPLPPLPQKVHPNTLTEEKLNALYKKHFGTEYNPLNDNDVNRASFLLGGEGAQTEFDFMKEPAPKSQFAPWSEDDPHIQLRGGRRFHFLRFKPEDIFIEDIAHSLSRLCRYNGYCEGLYSVAQHSVHVSAMCPTEAKLWGLLHDASEAYIGDMVRPWKSLLWLQTPRPYPFWQQEVRRFESTIQQGIAKRFGLPWPMPESVHKADEEAGRYEWDNIMDSDWMCWQPGLANQVFLDRFKELGGKEC